MCDSIRKNALNPNEERRNTWRWGRRKVSQHWDQDCPRKWPSTVAVIIIVIEFDESQTLTVQTLCCLATLIAQTPVRTKDETRNLINHNLYDSIDCFFYYINIKFCSLCTRRSDVLLCTGFDFSQTPIEPAQTARKKHSCVAILSANANLTHQFGNFDGNSLRCRIYVMFIGLKAAFIRFK